MSDLTSKNSEQTYFCADTYTSKQTYTMKQTALFLITSDWILMYKGYSQIFSSLPC